MKKLVKRGLAFATVLALALTVLSGCSASDGATLAYVGDSIMNYGAANLFARYNQMSYETYYPYMGYDINTMWTTNVSTDEDGNDLTLEQQTKDSILEEIKSMLILEQHAEEMGVSISDEDRAKMQEVVEAVKAANDASALKKISATDANILRVLELLTIRSRMSEAMVADVDTEVSDEEAAQKLMYYVTVDFESNITTTDDLEGAVAAAINGGEDTQSDENKAADEETAKAQIEEFFAQVKAEGIDADGFVDFATEHGFNATPVNFNSETTDPSEAVIAAADKLKAGETTTVTELDHVYGIYLASEHDEEATQSNRESIIAQRKQDAYNEKLSAWEEETEVVVNDNLWNKISFEDMGVEILQKETEGSDSE